MKYFADEWQDYQEREREKQVGLEKEGDVHSQPR